MPSTGAPVVNENAPPFARADDATPNTISNPIASEASAMVTDERERTTLPTDANEIGPPPRMVYPLFCAVPSLDAGHMRKPRMSITKPRPPASSASQSQRY